MKILKVCNMLPYLFAYCCFFTRSVRSCKGPSLGDVKFVSVLFRHGDRSPHSFYPNDPYKKPSLWPEGFGQLTNIGKQQEYALGKWLRTRYSALFTPEYDHEKVYAFSTDVDRTLMSAQCVLAGIFPPAGKQLWNPDIKWQPIPVHTIPSELDNVYTGYAPCPAYEAEYAEMLKSPEIQSLHDKFSPVIKILNAHTGKQGDDLVYVFKIYSILFVEESKNLTLPKWTKPIYPRLISEASAHHFTYQTRTKKLARFKAGLMIHSMTEDMKNKMQGGKRNVHLYSGHEHTVANLLNALGVFDLHNPPYAATVLVELRDIKGAYYVSIYYRNSTEGEPHLLTIPGCASACPFETFESITEPLAVSPEDWTKECNATKKEGENAGEANLDSR